MKCRRIVTLVVCMIFSFLSSQAQWDDAIIQNPGAGKFMAGMYGNADYSSSAITSAFATNFIEGNYLDSAQKQQVSSRLKNSNRLGYSLNYGIFGVLYNDTVKGKRAFNFFIALRHKAYLNIEFPPD
ncbi:MAG TPA: hypothetical protein VK808_06745, partial [Bacteroidia bacterium]|nr:hypothetical protein [Bacteroidia bacterium]